MNIRIILLNIILFLILGINTYSQELKYGFIVGTDISNSHLIQKPERLDDKRMYYPIVSFNLNGYLGIRINELWTLAFEPGYIQKGGMQKQVDGNVVFRQNLIQVPIAFEKMVSEKITFFVGPELAYMINAKVKYANETFKGDFLYDRNFECSTFIGLEYYIKENMSIGLRYNHGITYIDKIIWVNDNGIPTGDISKEYNQYIQISFKILL